MHKEDNTMVLVRLNVGGMDRILRILGGALIMFLVAASHGKWELEVWWGVLVGAIGFFFFVTGVLAWCPFYHALHISTHRHITGKS